MLVGLNLARGNMWEDALSELSSFLTLINLAFNHWTLTSMVVCLNLAYGKPVG